MSRWFERILIAGALILPVSLLGAPDWAVALAIVPALWVSQAMLPDPPQRDESLHPRLPLAQQLALLSVICVMGITMGLAGVLDSPLGVLIWFGASGAIIAVWRSVDARRTDTPTA
ncbi:MAG: hypothetical protein M3N04_07280 [Actinomycetota bacterium]|nr:hypothetical protein [Actinomycetota bacterium]